MRQLQERESIERDRLQVELRSVRSELELLKAWTSALESLVPLLSSADTCDSEVTEPRSDSIYTPARKYYIQNSLFWELIS